MSRYNTRRMGMCPTCFVSTSGERVEIYVRSQSSTGSQNPSKHDAGDTRARAGSKRSWRVKIKSSPDMKMTRLMIPEP